MFMFCSFTSTQMFAQVLFLFSSLIFDNRIVFIKILLEKCPKAFFRRGLPIPSEDDRKDQGNNLPAAIFRHRAKIVRFLMISIVWLGANRALTVFDIVESIRS